MDTNIIDLNMEGYLCEFLRGYYRVSDIIHVDKTTFLGHLIFLNIERVPENCRFIFQTRSDKKILRIEYGFLGNILERRKNPLYNYYLPQTKQALIEKYILMLFDELLNQYLTVSYEVTEIELKTLIEKFCDIYRIDFATYYETLKKKYYRSKRKLGVSMSLDFSSQLALNL